MVDIKELRSRISDLKRRPCGIDECLELIEEVAEAMVTITPTKPPPYTPLAYPPSTPAYPRPTRPPGVPVWNS